MFMTEATKIGFFMDGYFLHLLGRIDSLVGSTFEMEIGSESMSSSVSSSEDAAS